MAKRKKTRGSSSTQSYVYGEAGQGGKLSGIESGADRPSPIRGPTPGVNLGPHTFSVQKGYVFGSSSDPKEIAKQPTLIEIREMQEALRRSIEEDRIKRRKRKRAILEDRRIRAKQGRRKKKDD